MHIYTVLDGCNTFRCVCVRKRVRLHACVSMQILICRLRNIFSAIRFTDSMSFLFPPYLSTIFHPNEVKTCTNFLHIEIKSPLLSLPPKACTCGSTFPRRESPKTHPGNLPKPDMNLFTLQCTRQLRLVTQLACRQRGQTYFSFECYLCSFESPRPFLRVISTWASLHLPSSGIRISLISSHSWRLIRL